MKQHLWKGQLSWALSLILSIAAPLPLARAQDGPLHINLVVVEGEGATNGARQRVARDPVVRVEDDDHRPVAGAAVAFVLPVSGASGEFVNGGRNLSVVTDQSGLAIAHGLRTNGVPGKLQIYVTASFRGMRARTMVNQTVAATPGMKLAPESRTSNSGGKWKWVILGVAAAGGAGAGIYFGTHSSSPSAIPISAGSVVFGSPK